MILEGFSVLCNWLSIDCVLVDLDSAEVKEKVALWSLQDSESDIKAAGEPISARQVKFDVV